MRVRGFCLVLALALVLLGPGCMDGPEWSDPKAGFTVEAIEKKDGRCLQSGSLSGISDPVCHMVTVSVTNEMNETDLEIEARDWTVVTRSGGVREAQDTEGPDAVAPGYTSQVVLLFELEQDEKIDLVRYKDFFNERHTTVEAPPY